MKENQLSNSKYGTIQILNKHYHVNFAQENPETKIFYIGRGSALGNPYSHLYSASDKYFCINRAHAVSKYKTFFIEQFKTSVETREYLKSMLNELKAGNNIALLCYCFPLQCHGDVIKKVLENHLSKQTN